LRENVPDSNEAFRHGKAQEWIEWNGGNKNENALNLTHFQIHHFSQSWFHAVLKFFVHSVVLVLDHFHQFHSNLIHDEHNWILCISILVRKLIRSLSGSLSIHPISDLSIVQHFAVWTCVMSWLHPGISHRSSRIIEGAARWKVIKLYLDQSSLGPGCVVSSSAVGRRTLKMGHMIWPGGEEEAVKGDYDGMRTYWGGRKHRGLKKHRRESGGENRDVRRRSPQLWKADRRSLAMDVGYICGYNRNPRLFAIRHISWACFCYEYDDFTHPRSKTFGAFKPGH
jgi:hypothetical protein